MISSTPRVNCANPRIKVDDLCAKWSDDVNYFMIYIL